MIKNTRKIYYFIKNYLNETVSLIIATIGLVLSFYFYKAPGLELFSLIVLAITSFVIIIFLKHKSRDFYHISFDKYNDKAGWVGNGYFDFDLNDQSFLIKDSDEGFIFSKCLNWIDYEMSCEFKILKDAFGIVIRATDLSNKLMLQFNIKAKGIRPHFWANGGYIVKEPKEFDLEFEDSLKEDLWYKVKVTVYRNTIKIELLKNNKIINEKRLDLSSVILSFPIRKTDKEPGDTKDPIGMLDIRKDYSYGTIGFRNGHGEKALVRNLLIKKI